MKTCGKCKEIKNLSDFCKNKNTVDGLNYRCRKCAGISNKKLYESNKEQIIKKTKAYSIKRKQFDPNYHRKRIIKNRFGISLEQYEEMVSAQHGKCKICDEKDVKLVIDHCHKTGRIRGLLCRGCNVGIGNLKDSAALLESAVKYLRSYGL